MIVKNTVDATMNQTPEYVSYLFFITNVLALVKCLGSQRFHLLLNVAFGGDWGGAQGTDDSKFPQKMEIDYVRVYKMIEMIKQ